MSFPEYMTPKDVTWIIASVFQSVVGGVAGGAYIKEDPFHPGSGRMDLDRALEDATRLASRIAEKGESLCTMHHLIRPGAEMGEAIKQAEARSIRRVQALAEGNRKAGNPPKE